MTARDQLLEGLRHPAALGDQRIRSLIESLEREAPADLQARPELLEGVWELRWSSSRAPYLRVAPWLENLQVLAPSRGRAMNLLRPSGAFSGLGGIAVLARIAVEGPQRVSVSFERGGWIGPALGSVQPRLMRQVNQSYPAWLDITVLDQELRVCRGQAGTLFALRRRGELRCDDLLAQAEAVGAAGPPMAP
ncbi:PAP/fibrillin family protein [Synechococcus sp. CS-1329]|uniref:PAP/fibrillin family protein n=1 Tax=Synechococcus sp. CS-1329 TaxID=2847975 RepID=UPI00223A76FF|nr:PAP/fibrillin family protein [Synechococcus sp. CS-1329]MCT0218101.1 PAP/fibrillin family protein [Synechococcus sp. CS-1329]